VIDDPAVGERDFTGGEGELLYRRMAEGGALFLSRPDADAIIKSLFSSPNG
jgi:hypothetical protein